MKKPRFTPSDRLWLVLLASRVQQWKHTLLTLGVQPETLLRWHRQGFRLFNVSTHPTDAWVAQQLREATPYGQTPRYLIRDRDGKYGAAFAQVAVGSGIEILKTPYRAPKANAICEGFLGTVRRECLDHILIVGEGHLYRVISEYAQFFNQARPHQGIEHRIPAGMISKGKEEKRMSSSRRGERA